MKLYVNEESLNINIKNKNPLKTKNKSDQFVYFASNAFKSGKLEKNLSYTQ